VQHVTAQFVNACFKNNGSATNTYIAFHTNTLHLKYNNDTDDECNWIKNKKVPVDNNGKIANKDTMNKGKKDGSEELNDYDDYYDDPEACDDGRKRLFDCHNAHVAAGKKAEKEGKWNRDLKIIADEDEEHHKEAD
jgi:hypothetical protein